MKGTLVIIFLVLAILTTVLWVVGAVDSGRTDNWLSRAKDAGNPEQVAEFLTNYKESLYDNNRVEGKYTSIFRYPSSYMPVYIRAIDGLIVRAQDLAKQDSIDTSYQMGLVNLEKDMGDIETAAYIVWLVDIGYIIEALRSISWIIAIIIGIIWLDDR